MPPARIGARRWLVAIAVLVLVVTVAILVGSVRIDPGSSVLGLLDRLPFIDVDHGLTEVEERVLFEIRLPRVVMGGIVGSMLAVGRRRLPRGVSQPSCRPVSPRGGGGSGARSDLCDRCRRGLSSDPAGRLSRWPVCGGGQPMPSAGRPVVGR